MHTTQTLPRLPRLLSRPLYLLPAFAWRGGLARLLNTLFATPIRAGELDFLHGRHVGIQIADAPLSFRLTLEHGRLVVLTDSQATDLQIEGSVYAFMLLASRQEDADTLFFQRQLRIQGDTELGLQVKNFLDGIDLSALPLHGLIETGLRRGLLLADHIERLRYGGRKALTAHGREQPGQPC